MTESKLSSVESALQDYRQGSMVIIVDDEDRENEGDLVVAADFASPNAINFMVTHGRGLVCLAMRGDMIDRLQIPMMVPQQQNRSGFGTGFTVSVEASHGVSTGISAHDRSHTIKTLINPESTPDDIAMPGHMFPLRARDGGVLARRGQTEASVDLSMLAGLAPAAVICEVMNEDGSMMRLDDLMRFGKTHQIRIISVEQLVQYRKATGQAENPNEETGLSSQLSNECELQTVRISSSRLPTPHGDFDIIVFRDRQGLEHSALIKGDVQGDIPLVRLHSECLTGDAFGSLRCDCGEQLNKSLQMISERGTGMVIYLRQEGRGIGLGNKIKAYALQDEGMDTVEANLELGFPADARTYDVAADILRQLNVQTLKLISNNPAKLEALQALGFTVTEQVQLLTGQNRYNKTYLRTKAEKMRHNIQPTGAKSLQP